MTTTQNPQHASAASRPMKIAYLVLAAAAAVLLALAVPAAAAEAPRDAASGQATGKRAHQPMTTSGGIEASGEAAAMAPNQNPSRSNHSSGGGAASASYAATGRAGETAGGGDIVEPDEVSGVKSPRDAASGLATGKRQHKPMTTTSPDLDSDNDGISSSAVRDHNSSRSNKSSISAPGGVGGGDADAQGMAINEKGMPGNAETKKGKTGSAK